MAYFTPISTDSRRLDKEARHRLDAFFASVGQGFSSYVERRARIDQIERLNAKSDAELAQMGLTRDRIPQYVFRDLLHL